MAFISGCTYTDIILSENVVFTNYKNILNDDDALKETPDGAQEGQDICPEGRILIDCRVLLPLIERRIRGEPLAKIIGQKEFWSMPFKTTKDTLDPRPDSETLISAVLDNFQDLSGVYNFVDFGTGTGCLLLSLLSEYKKSLGIGIDISEKALSIALKNAQELGLKERSTFKQGNWAEGFDKNFNEYFDVIVSNPPYIGIWETLDSTVKDYDPHLALFAGEDGLSAYRSLLPQLPRLMHQESLLFLEIGIGQESAVKNIAEQFGLSFKKSFQDLSGVDRVLMFKK